MEGELTSLLLINVAKPSEPSKAILVSLTGDVGAWASLQLQFSISIE